MSTTISANANAPQPVTLCYRRTHKLAPHEHHAKPGLPRHTPAAYPCPPLYRNTQRLPFVQRQWYRETLQAGERRGEQRVEPADGLLEEEVSRVEADWAWSISKLVQTICKADGVLVGKKAQKAEAREQDEREAKRDNTAAAAAATARVADWKREEDEDDKREEDEAKEAGHRPTGLVIKVDVVADEPRPAASSSLSSRSAFLSPKRQRGISEEEEKKAEVSVGTRESALSQSDREESTRRESAALGQRLSPRSSSSARSSLSTPRSPRSPRAAPSRPSYSAADKQALASFIPLPPHFTPSLHVTAAGRSRIVRLDTEKGGQGGGGGWLLSALRDRWMFGVSESGRVGVLVMLYVYGYIIWVRHDMPRVKWGRQLTDLYSDDADDKTMPKR